MGFGNGELKAILTGRHENKAILKLIYDGNLDNVLNRIGQMPLPPYIRRKANDDNGLSGQDKEKYQTIFASLPGAIAAPTAGLHFTPRIIKSLNKKGIDTVHLTLHVGIGTFQPIRTETIIEHKMQPEQFYIPEETSKALINARKDRKKIVGESVQQLLVFWSLSNWIVFHPSGTSGWTNRFIYPGSKFKEVDHLTNQLSFTKVNTIPLSMRFCREKAH